VVTPESVVPPPSPRGARKPRLERVVIRSLPKVVFLYPTMLVAAAASVATWQDWGSASLWGHIFLITLGLNLVVIAFEFPRTTSLTLLFLIAAAILGAILLNQRYDVFPWLDRQTGRLNPNANAQFYGVIAVVIAAILVGVFIIHTWFDYWEVLSNELIHHHGILGSLERLPSPGIKFDKEITDIFEFFILGSGRLIITPAGEGRPIILENVPRINHVERNIKTVLGVTEVQVNPG
jgi:hypothetical protein